MVNQKRVRKTANVAIRTVSDEEAFLIQDQGLVRTQERFSDEMNAGGATITHTRPGRVLMWKPIENGTYVPRTVSESSKGVNLQMGWKIKCP